MTNNTSRMGAFYKKHKQVNDPKWKIIRTQHTCTNEFSVVRSPTSDGLPPLGCLETFMWTSSIRKTIGFYIKHTLEFRGDISTIIMRIVCILFHNILYVSSIVPPKIPNRRLPNIPKSRSFMTNPVR